MWVREWRGEARAGVGQQCTGLRFPARTGMCTALTARQVPACWGHIRDAPSVLGSFAGHTITLAGHRFHLHPHVPPNACQSASAQSLAFRPLFELLPLHRVLLHTLGPRSTCARASACCLMQCCIKIEKNHFLWCLRATSTLHTGGELVTQCLPIYVSPDLRPGRQAL